MTKYGETAQFKIRKIITESAHNSATTDKNQLRRPKALVIGLNAARNNNNIEELQGE